MKVTAVKYFVIFKQNDDIERKHETATAARGYNLLLKKASKKSEGNGIKDFHSVRIAKNLQNY